jgi:hypothetical protein
MAEPINQLDLLKKLQAQISEEDTPEQPAVTAAAINPDMSEADIKKKLYEMLGQSMTQQSSQIEALKAQAAKEKAYQEQIGTLGKLDLRPFAQAAKGYGATNVYVPSEAPEDRIAILNKLENAVSEAQQGLTKDQVAALKNMMEAGQQRGALQALQSEENRKMRMFENVSRKFDKPQQELADFYQAHDAFKSALGAGDVAAVQSALSNYSRMTGEKGVLTDQDIARVITPTISLKFAQLRSKLLSDPNTPVPKEILTSLSSGLDRLKAAAETKIASKINAAERQTSTGPGLYKSYAQQVAEEARKGIRSKEESQATPMSFEEFKKKRAEGSL